VSDKVALLTEFWRVWKRDGAAGLVARYDEFFHPDAEWSPPMRELTGMRYVGREGLERYAHDLAQVLEGLEGELEEIVEVAPDVVRSRVRLRAKGKVSGMALDAEMIAIGRFRDGRMSLAWASYDPELAARAEAAIINDEPVTS
jgi:ketosteroid isomerase-like protein